MRLLDFFFGGGVGGWGEASPKESVPATIVFSGLVWFKALWRLLRGGKLHSSLVGSFPGPGQEPAQIPSSNCAKKETAKAGAQHCFK